jgi:hypothetical protein
MFIDYREAIIKQLETAERQRDSNVCLAQGD